ncbi:hypothetical protein V1506DRAFT_564232 [Lipomyces tetrasporus]
MVIRTEQSLTASFASCPNTTSLSHLYRTLLIGSHNPPPPTWTDTSLTYELARERESIHPLERCLIHPPALVKIVEPVRTGDRHNAKLVTIRTEYVPPELANASLQTVILSPKFMILSILIMSYVDAFLFTDQEYSREAAAYTKLSFMQGTIIPKFYGTFTFGIPIPDKGISRSVGLILLEAIPGKPMTQLEPTDYSQAERQDIIKALIGAESLLYTNDVWHRDIHPRNAWVGRAHPLLAPEAAQKYLPGVPISPLLRWTSFAAWIDWDWEPWLEQHFGSTRASITKDMEEVWRP